MDLLDLITKCRSYRHTTFHLIQKVILPLILKHRPGRKMTSLTQTVTFFGNKLFCLSSDMSMEIKLKSEKTYLLKSYTQPFLLALLAALESLMYDVAPWFLRSHVNNWSSSKIYCQNRSHFIKFGLLVSITVSQYSVEKSTSMT